MGTTTTLGTSLLMHGINYGQEELLAFNSLEASLWSKDRKTAAETKTVVIFEIFLGGLSS